MRVATDTGRSMSGLPPVTDLNYIFMADFVAELERLAGRKANVRSIPAPASEVVRTGADITKAAAHFGYQPQVSVETGLKLFWEWIAAQ